MNGADWTSRYSLIVAEAGGLDGSAVIDAEVVFCAGEDGVPDFELLHDRSNDHIAIAWAFDLLMRNGEDLRRKPFADRKAALRKLLRRWAVTGYSTSSTPKSDGDEMFQAACKLGLEGIVSKRIDAPYRSGPARSWLKIRNPKAPAATLARSTERSRPLTAYHCAGRHSWTYGRVPSPHIGAVLRQSAPRYRFYFGKKKSV